MFLEQCEQHKMTWSQVFSVLMCVTVTSVSGNNWITWPCNMHVTGVDTELNCLACARICYGIWRGTVRSCHVVCYYSCIWFLWVYHTWYLSLLFVVPCCALGCLLYSLPADHRHTRTRFHISVSLSLSAFPCVGICKPPYRTLFRVSPFP